MIQIMFATKFYAISLHHEKHHGLCFSGINELTGLYGCSYVYIVENKSRLYRKISM